MPHYAILPPGMTAAHADQVAQHLMLMWRPASTRSAQDVVTHYGWVIAHTDGRLAMALPDFDIRLHTALDRNALHTFLGTLGVPAARRDAMRTRLVSRLGDRDHPKDFLFAALGVSVKTQAEMYADGWPVPAPLAA
jgi:hypothetical protein